MGEEGIGISSFSYLCWLFSTKSVDGKKKKKKVVLAGSRDSSFHPPESPTLNRPASLPHATPLSSPTRCISIIKAILQCNPFWPSCSEERQHPLTFSDFQAWFLVYSASTSSGSSRDSRIRGSLSGLVLQKKWPQSLPNHLTWHSYPTTGLETLPLYGTDLSVCPENITECLPYSRHLSKGMLAEEKWSEATFLCFTYEKTVNV